MATIVVFVGRNLIILTLVWRVIATYPIGDFVLLLVGRFTFFIDSASYEICPYPRDPFDALAVVLFLIVFHYLELLLLLNHKTMMDC